MECPSCYEFFDSEERVPRNLTCGHTFCEECLTKIEIQKLSVCPICRTCLPKLFKAKKLPKNFIALEYAIKQQEQLKKSNFCQNHPKELMRHYCITCKHLICIECIVDHSGHEFVRKEESTFVLKENAEGIVNQLDILSEKTEGFLKDGFALTKEMKSKKIKDMKEIDGKFDKIIKLLQHKKAQSKKKYNDAFQVELDRVHLEQENFEKHMSLISFNKDTVMKTLQELEQYSGKKIQGSELSNKLENFKRQEEELYDQTQQLQPIKISYPTFEINTKEFEKSLQNIANIQHRTVLMTNRKICFFGDTNKVMTLDVQTEKWQLKTLPRSNNEFLYYSAAVTLPNGDALITGGGSSTAVYQYSVAKEELIQKRNMNQMRKEHAAVIFEGYVYVMGGYDGIQNIFLNSCEVYNIQKNEWSYFAPMNIQKCAFSATIVNKKYIYTFGGYDGQNRLEAIERYSFTEASWELLRVKLKFPLSNCACFCPDQNKVVIFGGGFSSGFSPYVEQIDIETHEWKSLPIMNEGRDLRNKVVYIDDNAYAIGGLNSKAEKFNFKKKQWVQLSEYPIVDNLDSWACALTYVPKEYSQTKNQVSVSSGAITNQVKEDEEDLLQLLEQEKLIDQEIQEELEKFKMERDIGLDLSTGEIRLGESEVIQTTNSQSQQDQIDVQQPAAAQLSSQQSASGASGPRQRNRS